MKKIMILISVIFLMCTGIWFRFHTKECRVVSDLAYDKNKKGDHLVYIREGHELVPFLVLTSDYNGETLLLRKEVLKMNMQINSYEAYYENSFMDDYLNHEYIRQLPDGMPVLESEIKITDEKSLGVSGTGTKSIKRKIFLLAYSEVMEDQNINAASEGTFLRFFEKEEQRIVLKESHTKNNGGQPNICLWCTRTGSVQKEHHQTALKSFAIGHKIWYILYEMQYGYIHPHPERREALL